MSCCREFEMTEVEHIFLFRCCFGYWSSYWSPWMELRRVLVSWKIAFAWENGLCLPQLGLSHETNQKTWFRNRTGTSVDDGKARVFRCAICRSVIGQATCLICARCRQLTFPFCFITYKKSFKTVVMQSSPRTLNRLRDSGDRRSGARCSIIITQLHHKRNFSLKNKLARGFGNNIFSIFLNR